MDESLRRVTQSQMMIDLSETDRELDPPCRQENSGQKDESLIFLSKIFPSSWAWGHRRQPRRESLSGSSSCLFRVAGRLTVIFFGLVALLGYGESLDSYGPFYHKGDLTLEPGRRTEMIGPLAVFEERESALTWSLAPLFSFHKDTTTDFREFDLLYPLVTYDQFGSDYRFQVLQLFTFAGGKTLNDKQNRRFTLFPFYFQQRSTDPALNYTALVPLYGGIKSRLMRDEIHFVLFPLYAKTRKRDVTTRNFVYPVFHLRQGDGLRGWQLWPLIGREHKSPTTKTNQFGENEIVGGHDKDFVLWPFYVNSKLGVGTENPQTQRALLPLFSMQRSPLRDSSTYLWPLGFTYTDDREKKYREWDAPWPLIVFARGEGKTVNRVWPLFSQAASATLQSDFYLWPLYKYNRVRSEPLDRERTRILFFLYSDLAEKNTATGTALKRTDLWPLFTARRDHQGNERLQLLAPFEPLVPNNKGIERNYSRLWSVWRSEKNGKTGATSQSLLWNLYRNDTTPASKKRSLLFGMLQYKSGPEGNRWRLLYIPIGKTKKSVAGEPQP
jgi:hypothetical protein